jgi:peroxiredoxin
MNKKFNWIVICVVFFVAISSFFLFINYSKADPLLKEAKSYQTKKIPITTLKNIVNFNDYSNEVIKDEAFFMYLVSTCDACKKQLRVFSESKQNLDPKIKIFVIMSEDEEVVRDYIKKNNIEIPVLIDKDAELLKNLDLKYFPSNFKLSNGIIKKVFFGSPKTSEELTELINYY